MQIYNIVPSRVTLNLFVDIFVKGSFINYVALKSAFFGGMYLTSNAAIVRTVLRYIIYGQPLSLGFGFGTQFCYWVLWCFNVDVETNVWTILSPETTQNILTPHKSRRMRYILFNLLASRDQSFMPKIYRWTQHKLSSGRKFLGKTKPIWHKSLPIHISINWNTIRL